MKKSRFWFLDFSLPLILTLMSIKGSQHPRAQATVGPDFKELKYGEFAAAPVTLIGMEWPTHHPMWEPLLDRLADVWEASLKYAAPE